MKGETVFCSVLVGCFPCVIPQTFQPTLHGTAFMPLSWVLKGLAIGWKVAASSHLCDCKNHKQARDANERAEHRSRCVTRLGTAEGCGECWRRAFLGRNWKEPARNKFICAQCHVHFIATDVHKRAVHKRIKKIKDIYMQPCENFVILWEFNIQGLFSLAGDTLIPTSTLSIWFHSNSSIKRI